MPSLSTATDGSAELVAPLTVTAEPTLRPPDPLSVRRRMRI